MARDTFNGRPFDYKKDGGKIVIKFYPESPTAKYPNREVFTLRLLSEDAKKLKKIIS